MSEEPTERDVETRCMFCPVPTERTLAERIAQARREGAAEAWDEGAEAVRQYDYHQPPVQNPYRDAPRGDA